jgi:hypothetical protein
VSGFGDGILDPAGEFFEEVEEEDLIKSEHHFPPKQKHNFQKRKEGEKWKGKVHTVANILSSLCPSPSPNPLLLLNASFVISKAELYLRLANSIASKLGPNSFVKKARLTALNVISRQESGCGQKAWR